MKKVLFLSLCFCALIVGTKAQEQISVSRFKGQTITGVEAGGAFEITIREGRNTGATVDIPARFQDQLVFSLDSEGVLKIGFRGTVKGKEGDRYTAEIVCTALRDIGLSGACKLDCKGDFTSGDLSVDLSGASRVTIDGKMQVTGGIKIGMSGASRFTGQVFADKVDIGASGASEITLGGKGERVRIGASGASKGYLEDFIARKMDVGVSGASEMSLNVVEEINVGASGGAKVDYTGSPRVTGMSTSGGASVNKR